MKKRLVVLILLLLASTVYAQSEFNSVPDFKSKVDSVNYEADYEGGIRRYTDFPLDNIHILRLQEASTSLGGNVSLLRDDLRGYEEEQQRDLDKIQYEMVELRHGVQAQLAALQNSVESMRVQAPLPAPPPIPDLQMPVEVKFPPMMFLLIGVNVLLLLLVIVLIFWMVEKYYTHKSSHKKGDHMHVAPKELVSFVTHQLDHKKKLHEIRMELAGKGWTPSIIEHAIQAARER